MISLYTCPNFWINSFWLWLFIGAVLESLVEWFKKPTCAARGQPTVSEMSRTNVEGCSSQLQSMKNLIPSA